MLRMLDRMGIAIKPGGARQAQEAVAALERAIARLPEDYERVIRLYDLAGRGDEDVAGELGVSAGAVRMLRARALVRLRDLIGSESRYFMEIE